MKKWEISKPITPAAAKKLAAYPVLTQTLLAGRGIRTVAAAEEFLNPRYDRDLHDPFLMKGMAKAVKRILEAIEKKERITLFGDYDADGVPGTVVLASFLREVGHDNFTVYIPDRFIENHGLSVVVVEKLAAEGTTLLVTIDCGITNTVPVARAKKLGVDVIITDHHLPPDPLPKAYAIIDNKQTDDLYPYKFLCGCGVAFKVVQALIQKTDHIFKAGWEKWLLDLVAISTVSDMVPLTGENRALTYFGLKVLRQTRRPGLEALFRSVKLRKELVSEDDIGFTLAPRLNAASRLSHANQSYFLLTTDKAEEATEITKHLEEKNNERKVIVEEMVAVVDNQLAELPNLPAVIVAGSERWTAGCLGLAASKLKDKYERSVFLWGTKGEDEVKGSCRSDGTVSLVALMRAAGDLDFFTEMGGHFMAAGFSLKKARAPELAGRLNDAYETLKKNPVIETIPVQAVLSVDDISWQNYDMVASLGPYGMENPKPIFLLRNIVLEKVKTFGNGGIHLELSFRNSRDKLIPAIGFFMCSPSEKFNAVTGHIFKGTVLEAGSRIDLLVNFEKSTFKSYPELRLRIVDLRPAQK